MKTTLKRIIAVILCAMITITGIQTGTVYAAGKTPLKVTFNKKSVTLSKDINKSVNINLKTLKKKLGNPKKKTADGYTTYTWKKGKTSIDYISGEYESITIDIQDKNGAMYGVKVGMNKDAALKKLKKIGAKEDSISPAGPDGTDESLWLPLNVLAAKVYFKDGKVSEIYFEAGL